MHRFYQVVLLRVRKSRSSKYGKHVRIIQVVYLHWNDSNHKTLLVLPRQAGAVDLQCALPLLIQMTLKEKYEKHDDY